MEDPFIMVVLIVLISVGAGVINNYLKLKARRQTDAASQDELDRMAHDIERLTERVRVLETIATDKDERLRDEIRRLA